MGYQAGMGGLRTEVRMLAHLLVGGLVLPALCGVRAAYADVAAQPSGGSEKPAMTIVHEADSDRLVRFAALEAQRLVYVRSGQLPQVQTALPDEGDVIVLAVRPDALAGEAFTVHARRRSHGRLLEIAGGSAVGVLYGVYRLGEVMGVRYGLEGEVLPDEPFDLAALPDLDEAHEPLFALRGIQPFHDFNEGPDWWDVDDYRAHLSQLVKLRMNFLGLHCYPEGPFGPEPLVWIGLPEDVNAEGRVSFSSRSRWASTQGGAWGYDAVATSEFAAGAGLLFEADEFGPLVTEGHRPWPTSTGGNNEVFNRAGHMLAEVVEFAHARGVQVCVGTETPLTIPQVVKERMIERGLDPAAPESVRLMYEGMFTRLARLGPVDWYWLWTPEGWTWQGASVVEAEAAMRDMALAREALWRLGDPFRLATCGWVLGPPGDPTLFDRILPREVAVSCINRDVGFEPVEPGFAHIEGRGKWAIPWMEDDPALIAAQLWAGRMRRDAADALAYGCDGIMGIHWRTRPLSPQVQALAAAAWDQEKWNPQEDMRESPRVATEDVFIGGAVADYPRSEIAGVDTAAARVYQTCRWNLEGYRLAVPSGRVDVTLKFCEVHYREAGKRVFGVRLQGREVVRDLDVFSRVGANVPLDLAFENVLIEDGVLTIEFVRQVEFPFISGIEVRGRDDVVLRRINCGGSATGEFQADLPAIGTYPELAARPRDMPVADFYLDWARSQFGDAVAGQTARIFTAMDGSPHEWQNRASHLPRPSDWVAGPGGIKINRTPWNVERARYGFVDELEALRPSVLGAANLERFDYWLNTFRALREIGRLGCLRGELDACMERIAEQPDPVSRSVLAQREALPVRLELARSWERLITLQLALVSNRGEMGTIGNLEQHVRRHLRFLDAHDAALAPLLGGLPPEAEPTRAYLGKPRLFVPTVRTDAEPGERLRVQAIVLDRDSPRSANAHVRALGGGEYSIAPARHMGRGVYELELPASEVSFEYWIEAQTSDGVLTWPPGAPGRRQSVTVWPQTRACLPSDLP
ncbi:MAG: hypothetical protein KJZ65_00060 [Phycisphaerales bacterium]|nr:hypothetical protein [Phycisphaerales bacterium]